VKTSLSVLIAAAGTAGGFVAGIMASTSPPLAMAGRSALHENDVMISRLDAVATRLEAYQRKESRDGGGVVAAQIQPEARLAQDEATVDEQQFSAMRQEFVRLADVIQRSQLLYGGRWASANHALLRAKPADWNALQRLGCAAREDSSDDTIIDEITFLEPADLMIRLGKPTRIGCLAEGAGQAWRFERNAKHLAPGEVYGLDIELDSNGLAMRVRNVDVVDAR